MCPLGEVFESKLSMFSKNYFPLPQSTYFVVASDLQIMNNHFISKKSRLNISFDKESQNLYYMFLLHI